MGSLFFDVYFYFLVRRLSPVVAAIAMLAYPRLTVTARLFVMTMVPTGFHITE